MKTGVVCLLATLLLLSLPGPGIVCPASGAAAPSGTVVLYTSESEDDVNALADDFMRRTPAVTLKIFRAAAGPVEAKIEAEMQAGRIQADVIWFVRVRLAIAYPDAASDTTSPGRAAT